jgi:phage-related protein (TIGR01555 family)
VKGLMDMIANQPDVMNTRMQLVDQFRSVLRAIILDADTEEFERVTTSFAGIPDMLEQSWSRLASAARMPKTKLMGTSPGGLNATGDSDLELWHATVASEQRNTVQPNLERYLRIYATARGIRDPESWTVKFAPLKLLSAKDRAAYQYNVAQRDQIYLQEGVLLPEEVALARFGSGTWSDEMPIDVDARREILKHRVDQEIEDARNPPPPPPVMVAPPKGAPPAPPAPLKPPEEK